MVTNTRIPLYKIKIIHIPTQKSTAFHLATISLFEIPQFLQDNFNPESLSRFINNTLLEHNTQVISRVRSWLVDACFLHWSFESTLENASFPTSCISIALLSENQSWTWRKHSSRFMVIWSAISTLWGKQYEKRRRQMWTFCMISHTHGITALLRSIDWKTCSFLIQKSVNRVLLDHESNLVPWRRQDWAWTFRAWPQQSLVGKGKDRAPFRTKVPQMIGQVPASKLHQRPKLARWTLLIQYHCTTAQNSGKGR